jgi:Lambda phage tail tube protein, TTP
MSIPTVGQPTAAAIGKGTTVGYAMPGTAPTFAGMAEIVDIKMPKHTAETIKVQRYDSPSLFPELIGGWLGAGDFEVQFVYAKAAAAPLFALLGQPQQILVTKPDTSTWTYQTIVTEFGDELPLKDKMTCTVKASISGAPVPSAASA